MRAGGKYKGLANLPEAHRVDVRQQVADMAGVCPRNVGNVEAILKIAHPTLIETVTFYDAATQIGAATTAAGVATFTTSSLTPKIHVIAAVYAGDATFQTSTGLVVQIVDLYATTTKLTSTPNPSRRAQTVSLTAVVTTGGSVKPTGTVNFYNGATLLGSATLDATGTARFTERRSFQ